MKLFMHSLYKSVFHLLISPGCDLLPGRGSQAGRDRLWGQLLVTDASQKMDLKRPTGFTLKCITWTSNPLAGVSQARAATLPATIHLEVGQRISPIIKFKVGSFSSLRATMHKARRTAGLKVWAISAMFTRLKNIQCIIELCWWI